MEAPSHAYRTHSHDNYVTRPSKPQQTLLAKLFRNPRARAQDSKTFYTPHLNQYTANNTLNESSIMSDNSIFCQSEPADSPPSLSPSSINSKPSSVKSNYSTKYPNSPVTPNKEANFRHTLYQSNSSPDTVDIWHGLERLTLDLPKISLHPDPNYKTAYEDFSDQASMFSDTDSCTASVVRNSIDTLTYSECEQAYHEANAEYCRSDATPSIISSEMDMDQSMMSDPDSYLSHLETTMDPSLVGTVLSKKDDFHSKLLESYMNRMDFADLGIDMALRKLLSSLTLPKEAQQIDRILTQFSKRYHEQNPKLFYSADLVYALSFSLILLHTDAHNKNVKHKMTREQFISQIRSLDNGDTIAPEVLYILFDNVTNLEFFQDNLTNRPATSGSSSKNAKWMKWSETGYDSSSAKASFNTVQQMDSAIKLSSLIGTVSSRKSPYVYRDIQTTIEPLNPELLKSPFKVKVKGANTSYQSAVQEKIAFDYSIQYIDEYSNISELQCLQEGLLLRKSDITINGKKSHLRNWREFWVVLAGSQLILFKDVSVMRMRKQLRGINSFPAPKPYSITSVVNAVCVIDQEYTKYSHTFRFVTSDSRQYLFRCQNQAEMTEWMGKINYIAAFKTNQLVPRSVSQNNFSTWRTIRPTKPKSISETEPEAERRELLINKVTQLKEKIKAIQNKIDKDLTLHKQMAVMFTFNRSTRDRAMMSADQVKARLKRVQLEYQKYLCYEEILQYELDQLDNCNDTE